MIALSKALHNSHWSVVLAILGTLGLQLTAVASTGLFTMESVNLHHIDTTPISQFMFDPSGYTKGQGDGRPAFVTMGIGWKGLAYPLGTSAEHAFQPFNVSSDVHTSTDSLITADVDVFTPGMDCETGTVVGQKLMCSNRQCIPMELDLTISTASCPGYFVTSLENDLSGGLGYYGSAQHLKCNEAVSGNKVDRLVFIAAHWNATASVDKLQVISCTPTYNMTRQQDSMR